MSVRPTCKWVLNVVAIAIWLATSAHAAPLSSMTDSLQVQGNHLSSKEIKGHTYFDQFLDVRNPRISGNGLGAEKFRESQNRDLFEILQKKSLPPIAQNIEDWNGLTYLHADSQPMIPSSFHASHDSWAFLNEREKEAIPRPSVVEEFFYSDSALETISPIYSPSLKYYGVHRIVSSKLDWTEVTHGDFELLPENSVQLLPQAKGKWHFIDAVFGEGVNHLVVNAQLAHLFLVIFFLLIIWPEGRRCKTST